MTWDFVVLVVFFLWWRSSSLKQTKTNKKWECFQALVDERYIMPSELWRRICWYTHTNTHTHIHTGIHQTPTLKHSSTAGVEVKGDKEYAHLRPFPSLCKSDAKRRTKPTPSAERIINGENKWALARWQLLHNRCGCVLVCLSVCTLQYPMTQFLPNLNAISELWGKTSTAAYDSWFHQAIVSSQTDCNKGQYVSNTKTKETATNYEDKWHYLTLSFRWQYTLHTVLYDATSSITYSLPSPATKAHQPPAVVRCYGERGERSRIPRCH